MLSKINLEIVSKCCRDIVSVVYDLVKKVVCFNINKFDRYAMYNVNDLCRVCLKRKTQQEMLSATKTQIEKLLFIGDPNKIIRINGHRPKLCIECGTHLDSVYDFIKRLRMSTLDRKEQVQTKSESIPSHFIDTEKKTPQQSFGLVLPYESTVHCKIEPKVAKFELPFDQPVHNVVVHCKIEPNLAYSDVEQFKPDVTSQSELQSVTHPESKDSFASTKSVDDLTSPLELKSINILDRTVEPVGYSELTSQLGDDAKDSIAFVEPTEAKLNSSLRAVGSPYYSQQKLQSEHGSSGLFVQPETDKLEAKPETLLDHTLDSIDATTKCQFCDTAFHNGVQVYSGPGFACTVEGCNFIFTHKTNFDEHVKWHSVVNPYCCKLEDEIFAPKDYLKSPVQAASEIRSENRGQSQLLRDNNNDDVKTGP